MSRVTTQRPGHGTTQAGGSRDVRASRHGAAGAGGCWGGAAACRSTQISRARAAKKLASPISSLPSPVSEHGRMVTAVPCCCCWWETRVRLALRVVRTSE